MLYVDWVSVDLNLTSRVFSGHSEWLIQTKQETRAENCIFNTVSKEYDVLYHVWLVEKSTGEKRKFKYIHFTLIMVFRKK